MLLWRRFRSRRRALVVAFLVGTGDDRARLQVLFDQIFAAAARTLFRDRLVRRSELALGIISAAIERVALARTLFDQVAFFAVGTLHANVVLLDVFAVGIATAGGELAVAAMADHHVATALRAELVERNVGNFLALIETARSLAIRISGARHKLAEPPSLEHHHPAA